VPPLGFGSGGDSRSAPQARFARAAAGSSRERSSVLVVSSPLVFQRCGLFAQALLAPEVWLPIGLCPMPDQAL